MSRRFRTDRASNRVARLRDNGIAARYLSVASDELLKVVDPKSEYVYS